jgi:hypothetical protein
LIALAGLFFFILLFLAVCIYIVAMTLSCAEAEYNWYLLINICSYGKISAEMATQIFSMHKIRAVGGGEIEGELVKAVSRKQHDCVARLV